MWYKDPYVEKRNSYHVAGGGKYYDDYDMYDDDDIPENLPVLHDRTKLRPSVKKRLTGKKPPKYDKGNDSYEFEFSKESGYKSEDSSFPLNDGVDGESDSCKLKRSPLGNDEVVKDYGRRMKRKMEPLPLRLRNRYRGGEVKELSSLIKLGTSSDDMVCNWLTKYAHKYPKEVVVNTLKKANRDDLVDFFLSESDIEVGDTIKSRFTSRVGEVVGVHWNGDTIEVQWEDGGSQLLSKESVYKISKNDPGNLIKVKSIYDNYGPILPKRPSSE